MGEIVLAAKMTHVPTLIMSEQDGPVAGKRQAAIDGHREIARRAEELGADTVVICDTHWVINAGFHINANSRFEGMFTSNEFPQFIQDLPYSYRGNPELGDAIAADRTLGGLCDWIEASAPQPVDLPVEGAATMKAAIVPVALIYSTADPLGPEVSSR